MDGLQTNKDLESRLFTLSQRLISLEEQVSRLKESRDHDRKRLEEVKDFSENIIALQEEKVKEVENNMIEQKKMVAELRTTVQTLQNSRVNHKDVLVKHENEFKKLIELVNTISEKQHESEMEKKFIQDARARRFSTFQGNEARVREEELYGHHERRQAGRRRPVHRRVQSAPVEHRGHDSRRMTK